MRNAKRPASFPPAMDDLRDDPRMSVVKWAPILVSVVLAVTTVLVVFSAFDGNPGIDTSALGITLTLAPLTLLGWLGRSFVFDLLAVIEQLLQQDDEDPGSPRQ